MASGPLRSNSEIMRAKIALGGARKAEAFARLWSRPDLGEVFTAYLILLHQIMRATVPLMEQASGRCEERAASDPICAALAPYYHRHAEEERDHDLWALEDLEAIGIDRGFALSVLPPPEAAALSGAQYYWLHHHHPVMLLGFIAVLEGSPPTEEHTDRLQHLTGLPDEAFRTYRLHGDVDPHHRDELDQEIDSLPLTRHHMGLIGISALHTMNAVADCIDNLEPLALEDAVQAVVGSK